MKSLILGHGKRYENNPDIDIRCSPIDKYIWLNSDYTSVDMFEDVEPNIVYDLRKYPWRFATSESYDCIIDTCGIGLQSRYKTDNFCKEINRVLKQGGVFYGYGGFTIVKN